MMNIFYGPARVDREKFIFERINPEDRCIILVPDQFSLQMEKNALAFFREKEGREALLNLMVADFSSLGNKVVKEAGGNEPELIDKYGRHMLLSLIIDSLADKGELDIYRKMKGRNSFIDGMNQLISEMKRYRVSAADIDEVRCETGSFLQKKLTDIGKIYREYEEAIRDRFTDTEDYMSFYGKLMARSSIICGADVWIYGFDTFTPLNMDVMSSILAGCRQLNIVMMCDDKENAGQEGLFDLSWVVIDNLREMAAGAGHSVNIEKIECAEAAEKAETVLAAASGIYAEAERAADRIWKLVREKGYRFSDITVICNDMEVRGSILKRTFDRWGIPAFADRKRKVLHQPVVRFLLSFMDLISSGYEGGAVMEMAGSGLMGWSCEDEQLLSNYVREAGIKGSKWKKEFKWTGRDDRGSRYSDEDLQRLNEMRRTLTTMTDSVRNEMGRRNTAREKVEGLYGFLENEFEIRRKIGELITRQQELGLSEGAAETAQSWSMICGLFTQIVRIIGEEQISNIQLTELMSAGLAEMEIGLVPAGNDLVIIGTLQRTRVSGTKCMIITAANEGVLPLQASESGLLTSGEMELLEDMKLSISKKETVRRAEEQLAIYRTLSLPEEELFVTCSLGDADGKSASPSRLFTSLKEQASGKILGDVTAGSTLEMISSRKGSLSHMAGAMRGYLENGSIDKNWLTAMNWYRENDSRDIEIIEKGLSFDNREERLEKNLAEALYFGDRDTISVSASRLETYTGCPFRHFIERGLKADEPRLFKIDGRSRGDIYHDAIQKLSMKLMPPEGTAVTAPDSPWMTITMDECRKAIEEIIATETAEYREGVYVQDGEGRLQLSRITETCSHVAWAMINQVRKSSTDRMYFEEPFGYGAGWLKPLEIKLESGKKAVLQGRIDRMDVIDAGGESGKAVRIIDYKTGNAEISRAYIEEGYKLQLMVYMNAVESAEKGIAPAGVFYFRIADFDVNADEKGTPTEKGETVEGRISKDCRLEGILVDNEEIIRAMDDELEPARSSSTIPVKQLKDGTIKAAGKGSELLSDEEFGELCRKAAGHVERICREIQSGNIEIRPKKEKGRSNATGQAMTACTYCGCRSICMFDTGFRNCRYELV